MIARPQVLVLPTRLVSYTKFKPTYILNNHKIFNSVASVKLISKMAVFYGYKNMYKI